MNSTPDRITSFEMTVVDVMLALSGGNPGAFRVLTEWFRSDPTVAIPEMVTLDTKRLYDSRIWDLYKLCGQNIERFKYHVLIELPHQETGQVSVSGPLSPSFDDKEFWTKRRFGRPGSFWALENPPTETNYEYPIQ